MTYGSLLEVRGVDSIEMYEFLARHGAYKRDQYAQEEYDPDGTSSRVKAGELKGKAKVILVVDPASSGKTDSIQMLANRGDRIRGNEPHLCAYTQPIPDMILTDRSR
ncbi:uncharacterized protein BDW43DRAFT_308032 [Aspergillus alliaceus]|uniref:uncharacterized protein n=1 Tax=Petromyces alliaceus TaxID=209559 RepID=UPI0012A4C0F7|nr:uncharacterized protein BDW43DRAFT_308032 [Aspergillus alliaceus]KAB8237020.1 hypothetical protein BDW43DRAFT_308032 [Aspergillus alliaceus]